MTRDEIYQKQELEYSEEFKLLTKDVLKDLLKEVSGYLNNPVTKHDQIADILKNVLHYRSISFNQFKSFKGFTYYCNIRLNSNLHKFFDDLK